MTQKLTVTQAVDMLMDNLRDIAAIEFLARTNHETTEDTRSSQQNSIMVRAAYMRNDLILDDVYGVMVRAEVA
jgi:hypothetical protein